VLARGTASPFRAGAAALLGVPLDDEVVLHAHDAIGTAGDFNRLDDLFLAFRRSAEADDAVQIGFNLDILKTAQMPPMEQPGGSPRGRRCEPSQVDAREYSVAR
jgi:hypothetical protein